MLTNKIIKTIEMCIKNPAKTDEIPPHIAKNRDCGMQTFDQHLFELVKENIVSKEEASIAAEEADHLERNLTLEL